MQEWQPIESAPSGYYILTYSNKSNRYQVLFWFEDAPLIYGWEPTHWIYLPTPPKE